MIDHGVRAGPSAACVHRSVMLPVPATQLQINSVPRSILVTGEQKQPSPPCFQSWSVTEQAQEPEEQAPPSLASLCRKQFSHEEAVSLC